MLGVTWAAGYRSGQTVEEPRRWRFGVVYALLALATSLWAIAVRVTTVGTFPPDPFYFARILPASYWLGLVVLCVAFLMVLSFGPSLTRTVADVLLLMVVIGYFWGTYCVLYALPVPHDAYLFMDNISTVALSGHLGGNTSWYLNMYPLATVFFHELQLLTGIALPQVVRFYPVLSNGLLLLMLYAVARSALGPQGVVAPVALASCNWVSQWHMVPQNYAMLLTVPLVLLLASMFCGRGRQNPVHRLLFMVITLAIVLGHSSSPILISVALVGAIALYGLLGRLSSRWEQGSRPSATHIVPLLVTMTTFTVVLFFGYALVEAEFVQRALVNWAQQVLQNVLFGDLIAMENRDVVDPSASYSLASFIRLSLTMTTLTIGAVVSVYMLMRRRVEAVTIGLVGLSGGYLFLSAALVLAGYNLYGYTRGFMLGLIPLSLVFCGLLTVVGSWKLAESMLGRVLYLLVVLLILAALLLSPITKNASDPYNYFSQSDDAAEKFLQLHAEAFDAEVFHQNWYNLRVLKRAGVVDYLRSFVSSPANTVYGAGTSIVILPGP